jgi:hypothetical protein
MPQNEYLVDYKNDCFSTNFSCYWKDKDPAREVTSSIALYIRWMEHAYHYGITSRLDKFPRDDWYFRRISGLYRLVNVLEISTAEIADRMRNMWMPKTDSKYGPINVQESIKHFLESWDIGKRRVLPVSEFETPLAR